MAKHEPMTDQEHAKAVSDAQKALSAAMWKAQSAGLLVSINTFKYSDLGAGCTINTVQVDVLRRLTNT